MDPPWITVKLSNVSRHVGESLGTMENNDHIHAFLFGVEGHIDVELLRRFRPLNA